MSSRKSGKWFMAVCATALVAGGASSVHAAASLDELLEQTRSVRQREAEANQEREKRFLVERNKQSAMLA